METNIMLIIKVKDGTIVGEARLSVSKWEGTDLVLNSTPYAGTATVAPIEDDQQVYPYAIAALRDAADHAIAAMMEKFARGEALLMRDVREPQKM